jgi:hypothetical protein
MGNCYNIIAYSTNNMNIHINFDQETIKDRLRQKKLKEEHHENFESNLILSERKKSDSYQSNDFLLSRNNSLNSNNDYILNIIKINLLKIINKLRQEPSSFIPLLDKYSNLIQFDSKRKLYYININNYKILIKKGKENFNETKGFLEKMKPVKKVIYFEDLNFNIPSNLNDLEDDKYFINEMNRIKNNSKINFLNIQYICHKNIMNEEYIILSIIIDFENEKDKRIRKILINNKYSKIGISLVKIDEEKNIYYIIMTFGEEKKNDD